LVVAARSHDARVARPPARSLVPEDAAEAHPPRERRTGVHVPGIVASDSERSALGRTAVRRGGGRLPRPGPRGGQAEGATRTRETVWGSKATQARRVGLSWRGRQPSARPWSAPLREQGGRSHDWVAAWRLLPPPREEWQ